MLDKQSEKVLKIAISKYNGKAEDYTKITQKEAGIHFTALNILCKSLFENGYILQYYEACAEDESVELILSNNGLHYFENKRKKNIEYLKNLLTTSVASLIVSIIAAIITTSILSA